MAQKKLPLHYPLLLCLSFLMAHPWLIALNTGGVLLVPCNTYLSPDLTFLLQLTSCPNLCKSQRQHIWQLQNDCFDTWSIQSSNAFIFVETWTPNSLHILMLIRQVLLTIENPLQHIYVFLVLILFPGAKKNTSCGTIVHWGWISHPCLCCLWNDMASSIFYWTWLFHLSSSTAPLWKFRWHTFKFQSVSPF